MRRLVPAVVVTALLIGATAVLGACGPSGTPTEPTLGTVDYSPKLVVSIADRGLTYTRGPREDPAVSTDPPVVPSGSVIQIANRAGTEQRLQGGTTFDTGGMHPGESTTVVLVGVPDHDTKIELVDPDNPTIKGTLTVGPKAAST